MRAIYNKAAYLAERRQMMQQWADYIGYRDPLTGKWVKAGYRAELHEIQARYAGKTVGSPEVRKPLDVTAAFDPYRRPDQ